jgi:hypothetical protein
VAAVVLGYTMDEGLGILRASEEMGEFIDYNMNM